MQKSKAVIHAKTLLAELLRATRDSPFASLLWHRAIRPTFDNGGNGIHAPKLFKVFCLDAGAMGIFGRGFSNQQAGLSCDNDSSKRANFDLYRDGFLVYNPCAQRPDSRLLYSLRGLSDSDVFSRATYPRYGKGVA